MSCTCVNGLLLLRIKIGITFTLIEEDSFGEEFKPLCWGVAFPFQEGAQQVNSSHHRFIGATNLPKWIHSSHQTPWNKKVQQNLPTNHATVSGQRPVQRSPPEAFYRSTNGTNSNSYCAQNDTTCTEWYHMQGMIPHARNDTTCTEWYRIAHAQEEPLHM